jgi:Mg-chelatase subunit ChlD
MSNALVAFVKKGEISKEKKEQLEVMKKRLGVEATNNFGGLSELLLLFDATGSMSNVWFEAKQGIEKLVDRLRKLFPEIKISMIAYRDYCDKERIIEKIPATNNIEKIRGFISNIRCDGGGDDPEAIEVALEEILKSEASIGILVGDAPPHGVIDEVVEKDFREVAKELRKKEKKVYTVSTNSYNSTVDSFREIAQITDGKHFPLEQLDDLIDVLSIAVAKHADKMNPLIDLIKKEQGGILTGRQKHLLE